MSRAVGSWRELVTQHRHRPRDEMHTAHGTPLIAMPRRVVGSRAAPPSPPALQSPRAQRAQAQEPHEAHSGMTALGAPAAQDRGLQQRRPHRPHGQRSWRPCRQSTCAGGRPTAVHSCRTANFHVCDERRDQPVPTPPASRALRSHATRSAFMVSLVQATRAVGHAPSCCRSPHTSRMRPI